MTHEELLSIMDNYTFKDSAEPVKALRAVIELHQPIWTFIDGSDKSVPLCIQCRDGDFIADYPCLTIQAIEKELR